MWNTVKLGDVLKTGAGGTPLKSKKEYYENGDVRWLLSGAVCEKEIPLPQTYITQLGLKNSSAKIFPKDTVLVAMYGATAGQVGILRFPCSTNQAVCGIYLSDNYLPEFLYYYLTSYKEELLEQASGVAQPNLSQIKIKNVLIPQVALKQQKRIVAKLDAVFAEIDKMITATKQKQKEVKMLKMTTLATELNNFDDKQWNTVKLGDVCEIIAGQSPESKNYNKKSKGLPFYQGKKDYGEKFLNPPKVWTTKITKRATANDILMSVRAPVGTLNIATEEICIGRGLAAIRVKEGVDGDYIFFSLLNIVDKLSGNTGAIFNSINKKQIETIPIPLPPLKQQKRIVAKLDAVFAEAKTINTLMSKQIINYQALKSKILAQELKGKVA